MPSPNFVSPHLSVICGSCGYELNLSSSNRNMSVLGSKRYGKSMKSGIMSFFSIDETRFNLIEQLRCKPYFVSPRSWGLFRRRIKLLCRRCGNHVGSAYRPVVSSSRSLMRRRSLHPAPAWGWDGISGASPTYEIRIRAVQPSSENSNIFSMI
ncbi:hypothetical protein Cgig2_015108 [Carnegiea gigantea]|uniref:Uncharacterized protein n=1 Tax=Carnegiea gigantea TaxID=171969 RepID=A0A9Q1KRG7_9CARY|nr:hypothetical protein Cgig2_015108 [Carnegiea gigantea]